MSSIVLVYAFRCLLIRECDILTKWFYDTEYNEDDKINCCIMEIRQDGMATVSISPDMLEAATKLKKKEKEIILWRQ